MSTKGAESHPQHLKVCMKLTGTLMMDFSKSMHNNWKNQETCHIVYNSRLQDLPLCNYVHQLLPGIRCMVELVTTTYSWDGKPLKV